MSTLSPELEKALGDAISGLPEAIRTGNFDDLLASQRQQVYEAVATALLGKDHKTVAAALVKALQNPTPFDWSSILKAWANETASSNPFAKDILDALGGNGLTKEKAIGLLTKWVKNEVKDPAVNDIIDGIASSSSARAILTKYLTDKYLPNDLRSAASAITQAIETGQFTAQQVLEVLAAWAVASGKEDVQRIVAQLRNSLGSGVQPETVILDAIGERLPADVKTILDEIIRSDWNGLLATIVGSLNLGVGQGILSDIVGGDFRKGVFDEIVQLLTAAGVNEKHAGPLFDAVIALATGTRSLFASGPEQSAPRDFTSEDISLWREIRSVIYMTQLVLKGGNVVPTDPQAQPHVFLAALIHLNTPVHDLVEDKTDARGRSSFVNTLTTFVDVHFGNRLHPPFTSSSTGTVVIDPGKLAPTSNSICRDIFDSVSLRIYR